MPEQDDPRVRLDKWLYAARFYKTRTIAAQAIESGRARVDDQRVKPSYTVKAGMRINLSKDSLVWKVEVTAVSDKRGPASEAARLYRESAESAAVREEAIAKAKRPPRAPRTSKSPTRSATGASYIRSSKKTSALKYLAISQVREVEDKIGLLVTAPSQVAQRGDHHEGDHPPRPAKRKRFRHAAAPPPERRARH